MRCLALVVLVGCAPAAAPPPLTPILDARAARDPVYTGDRAQLHVATQHTLTALVSALAPAKRARLAGLTLAFDGGDVNAYATCSEAGIPLVIVTDSLLEIARQLAVARAADETYGTERVRAYTHWVVQHPNTPAAAGDGDRRTLDLARVLFVEELAYVLGHELGHHTLGHLGCLDGGTVVEQLGREAANAVPLFSQAAELAADAAGIQNTLAVGGWSEAGALLVLQFFRNEQSWDDVALAFDRSHPLAEVRLPTVTATADLWRALH